MTAVAAAASRLPSPRIIGLFLVFAASAGLALWQASKHLSPTIFTDELEMTTLSRSIADTGTATLRGQAVGIAPLAAYLAAPFWWVSDVPTAYSLIKGLGAILMATAVFPAYCLARLAVRPVWALFAAAGTGLAPALAYAPILVKEPTAYPAGALALFLIARWVATPRRGGFLLALAACLLGYAAKDQLVLMFAVLALATAAVGWQTGRARSFRAGWTRGDWVGAATLAAGLAIVAGAFVARRSQTWYVATTFYQDRMIDYGLWAAGALTIGLGVVPVVAGLASLVRPKLEERRNGVEALAIVTVSAIACFGFYTAIKAAYLSTVYATLTLERNLIFLVPLLFAGTALFFQRGGGRWWAVAVAGCFALYLVRAPPYSLEQYPNYEAHGLAIAAFANRILRWPADTIENVLVAVTVVSTVALAFSWRLRGRRAGPVVLTSLAAASLAWTTTTEVYAAHGEKLFAQRFYDTLPKPVNWLDRATGTRPVVFLGLAVADPNPVHLLEFWNRSVKGVWSLDGSAPGPGATVTPDLQSPDGTLTPPGTDFVLTVPGVDVIGTQQGELVGGYRLLRLPGRQLRLRSAKTGIYPDGWMGGRASYAFYDVPPGSRGVARVSLSRSAWCGKDKRGNVSVRLGTLAVSDGGQPTIGQPLQERSWVIHSCQQREFVLPTPSAPWLVDVTIEPTFSPAELDPSLADPRQLGAVVGFGYEPR